MKNFEYYGLFLTEESKTKLKAWLWENGYDFNNDIIKGTLPENWHLDHCTLLHRSQSSSPIGRAILDSLNTLLKKDIKYEITVNAIGVSEKAMAFNVIFPKRSFLKSYNEIPHITICTFNGGKPVDSNSIINWKSIEPIIVETKLEKR